MPGSLKRLNCTINRMYVHVPLQVPLCDRCATLNFISFWKTGGVEKCLTFTDANHMYLVYIRPKRDSSSCRK